MMKIEIEKDFPQYFKPAYPEEFEMFSHFEVTAGIPTVLFAVTTWKENGKPNVCFHSWSCFHGDKTAFFAVMGALNLWIAYQFDTDTWVTFKLFGGMGLMFLFVLGQALYISRFVKDAPAQPSEPRA